VVHFDRLYDALVATPIILQVEPSTVELLDNLGLTMCRQVPEYARLLTTFIEGEPNCVLIVEFYGENDADLEAKIERLKTHLKNEKVGGTITPAITPQLQANIWKVRKVGLGLLMSIKGDYKPIPFIEDAAVPVEHLAEYVTRVEQFCNDLGTKWPITPTPARAVFTFVPSSMPKWPVRWTSCRRLTPFRRNYWASMAASFPASMATVARGVG